MTRRLLFVLRVAFVVAFVAVVLATGWVVGLVVSLGVLVSTALAFRRTALALEPTRRCGHCGFEADTYGLFRCGSCGGVSTGSVWHCALCNAEYQYFACPACSVAIRSPERGLS